MDIPTFSNMSYASGNMVIEDSSAVLAKNIANVIPTIHHNLKRALHLNIKGQTEFSPDSVPVIEVIPPSPPGRESKKSFVGVKLDKVLNQTIQVCRRYSMPYIHPEHLGDNLHKDLSMRRSSMPVISNKYLLQVPKPEKKRRRRHSLPVNMEQARKSYKGKVHHDFSFTGLNEHASQSHDDLSFDGRVHQVYISGFISDNDKFENISDVHTASHGSPKKRAMRRKNNDGRILSRMVDNPVGPAKSTEYLSRQCGVSDDDDDDNAEDDDDDDDDGNDDGMSTSPEPSLASCLSLSDLLLDDENSESSNKSFSCLSNDGGSQEIDGDNWQINMASLRSNSLYRTVSEPFDLDSDDHLSCVIMRTNHVTRDGRMRQRAHHDKVNKQIIHTEGHSETCLCNVQGDHNDNDRRFITGDILVKRGNKKCNVNDDKLCSEIRNNFVLRNNTTLENYASNRDYYLIKQTTNNDCKCHRQKYRPRSRSVVESTHIKTDRYDPRHVTGGVKSQKDILSCCELTSKLKSLAVIDHNSNLVNDKENINTNDLINVSGFVDRQTSCESIKSKSNNKDSIGFNHESVTGLSKSEQEPLLTGSTNNNIAHNSDKPRRQVREVHGYHTFYGGNIEQYEVNVDYFSRASDDHTCFNYDFNHSSLEKSNSMSHLYDIFNRARNRRQILDRPVSFHEDSVNFEMCDDINGHAEYDCLMGKNASSLDELENQSSDDEKLNFTNSVFRKAASLCELQNEKFKEGFAKLERRVYSGHSCSIEENTETWFPRLSFEDCSSCASCRSKSSSYHSLLYDTDTASGYQIYQPTVCDVDNTATEVENDDSCDIAEPSKLTLFKSRKDKIMKQGQEALGTFKDKLRKSKSNPFKL